MARTEDIVAREKRERRANQQSSEDDPSPERSRARQNEHDKLDAPSIEIVIREAQFLDNLDMLDLAVFVVYF